MLLFLLGDIYTRLSCSVFHFYLPSGITREGGYEMHPVCASMLVSLHLSISVSHRFLQNLVHLHIFGKLIVLMDFFCSSKFFRFFELWPKAK